MTGSRRSALPTGGVMATRREMLRSFGLAAAAAAASACSAEQVADSGVDRLRFLNWNDYIDEGPDGTVARFERSTGVKVAYAPELNDNVEMYNRFAPDLRAGKRIPYDLLCPTFWMAERMLAEDLLDPLPIAELQNHANLDVPFLQLPWDRGARYQMPYQVVVAGIAYNEALTGPVNSMGELLTRSDLAGKVSVLSEMLDTVGLMLLAEGSDVTNVLVDDAQRSIARLRDLLASGHVAAIHDSEDYLAALRDGTVHACVAWAGDIIQMQRDDPSIKFVFPTEGAMRSFDTMVIPKGTPNRSAVAKWMNYLYDPSNAARVTRSIQYISPVLGVQVALERSGADGAELSNSPLLFPDAATRARMFTWGGTTADELDALLDDFAALQEG